MTQQDFEQLQQENAILRQSNKYYERENDGLSETLADFIAQRIADRKEIAALKEEIAALKKAFSDIATLAELAQKF